MADNNNQTTVDPTVDAILQHTEADNQALQSHEADEAKAAALAAKQQAEISRQNKISDYRSTVTADLLNAVGGPTDIPGGPGRLAELAYTKWTYEQRGAADSHNQDFIHNQQVIDGLSERDRARVNQAHDLLAKHAKDGIHHDRQFAGGTNISDIVGNFVSTPEQDLANANTALFNQNNPGLASPGGDLDFMSHIAEAPANRQASADSILAKASKNNLQSIAGRQAYFREQGNEHWLGRIEKYNDNFLKDVIKATGPQFQDSFDNPARTVDRRRLAGLAYADWTYRHNGQTNTPEFKANQHAISRLNGFEQGGIKALETVFDKSASDPQHKDPTIAKYISVQRNVGDFIAGSEANITAAALHMNYHPNEEFRNYQAGAPTQYVAHQALHAPDAKATPAAPAHSGPPKDAKPAQVAGAGHAPLPPPKSGKTPERVAAAPPPKHHSRGTAHRDGAGGKPAKAVPSTDIASSAAPAGLPAQPAVPATQTAVDGNRGLTTDAVYRPAQDTPLAINASINSAAPASPTPASPSITPQEKAYDEFMDRTINQHQSSYDALKDMRAEGVNFNGSAPEGTRALTNGSPRGRSAWLASVKADQAKAAIARANTAPKPDAAPAGTPLGDTISAKNDKPGNTSVAVNTVKPKSGLLRPGMMT